MALQLITRSTEVKLVEALNALDSPEGWKFIHFHLDGLLEEYKSDYQVKIAINLIHDLLKSYEGSIFVLSDRGIVLLVREMVRPVINKLVFQLRYLYMDDPLAYLENGDENPNFCTVYDLGQDFRKCLDIATRRMAHTMRKASANEPRKSFTSGTQDERRMVPSVTDLNATGLATLEDQLRMADLTRTIRRQPVCGVLQDGHVRKVFDELYIHIVHLRQTLKTDVDFFSNRWLFKYLTQILDERMLEQVGGAPGQYLSGPISLNLNAETLLSRAFSDFDAKISPAQKTAIVIEIPVVDVFADISGFLVAKNEVQKMGYRVCLDGITTKSLISIDREKLGVDLLKVQWNADVQSDLQNKENQDMVAAIQRCGTKRIILCRCDTKQAVNYGQALGISLFQGRYLDNVLDPDATIEN